MNTDKKYAKATMTISGHSAEPYDEPKEGPSLIKGHSEERYSGEIAGVGVLEFVQANQQDGSATFTGIKRITGTLDGKQGSFLLQDTGTVKGTKLDGDWLIVPGSGTGELVGLRGDGGIHTAVDADSHPVHLNYWFE